MRITVRQCGGRDEIIYDLILKGCVILDRLSELKGLRVGFS